MLASALLGDVSQAVESVTSPGSFNLSSVTLHLLAITMLVIVNPVSFIFSLVSRRFESSSSVTDVLIPISMILGTVIPGASTSSATLAFSVFLSYVITSVFSNGRKIGVMLVVGRVRVIGAHLNLRVGLLEL